MLHVKLSGPPSCIWFTLNVNHKQSPFLEPWLEIKHKELESIQDLAQTRQVNFGAECWSARRPDTGICLA